MTQENPPQDQKHGRGQEDWPDGTRPDGWSLWVIWTSTALNFAWVWVQDPWESIRIHQIPQNPPETQLFSRCQTSTSQHHCARYEGDYAHGDKAGIGKLSWSDGSGAKAHASKSWLWMIWRPFSQWEIHWKWGIYGSHVLKPLPSKLANPLDDVCGSTGRLVEYWLIIFDPLREMDVIMIKLKADTQFFSMNLLLGIAI